MASSFTDKLPASVENWLDPALIPAYLIAAGVVYFTGRYIDTKYVRPPSKTGFGKGAPGFMTNTAKIRVTPEIAARLRRGEQVPQEEIEAATRAAEAKASGTDNDTPSPPPMRMTRSAMKKKAAQDHAGTGTDSDAPSTNEWIPETHTRKGPQGRRKR